MVQLQTKVPSTDSTRPGQVYHPVWTLEDSGCDDIRECRGWAVYRRTHPVPAPTALTRLAPCTIRPVDRSVRKRDTAACPDRIIYLRETRLNSGHF